MLDALRSFLPNSVTMFIASAVFITGSSLYACGGSDDAPRSIAPPTTSGPGFGGSSVGGTDVATGMCDEGLIRDCKIYIDENNCFVGEQKCIDDEWSDCLDVGYFDGGGGQA